MSEWKIAVPVDSKGLDDLVTQLGSTQRAWDEQTEAGKKASDGMDKIQTELGQTTDAIKKSGGVVKKLKENWVQFSVSLDAITNLFAKTAAIAKGALDFAEQGAIALQVAKQFDVLGGKAEDMERLRAASVNIIDDTTLQQIANTGERYAVARDEVELLIAATINFGQQTGKTSQEMIGLAQQVVTDFGKDAVAGAIEKVGLRMSEVEDRVKAAHPEFATYGKEAQKAAQKSAALALIIERDLVPSTDDAATKMGQASNAYNNFISDLQVMTAEMLIGSGALDSFGTTLDTVKEVFVENKDEIIDLVKVVGNLSEIALPALLIAFEVVTFPIRTFAKILSTGKDAVEDFLNTVGSASSTPFDRWADGLAVSTQAAIDAQEATDELGSTNVLVNRLLMESTDILTIGAVEASKAIIEERAALKALEEQAGATASGIKKAVEELSFGANVQQLFGITNAQVEAGADIAGRAAYEVWIDAWFDAAANQDVEEDAVKHLGDPFWTGMTADIEARSQLFAETAAQGIAEAIEENEEAIEAARGWASSIGDALSSVGLISSEVTAQIGIDMATIANAQSSSAQAVTAGFSLAAQGAAAAGKVMFKSERATAILNILKEAALAASAFAEGLIPGNQIALVRAAGHVFAGVQWGIVASKAGGGGASAGASRPPGGAGGASSGGASAGASAQQEGRVDELARRRALNRTQEAPPESLVINLNGQFMNRTDVEKVKGLLDRANRDNSGWRVGDNIAARRRGAGGRR